MSEQKNFFQKCYKGISSMRIDIITIFPEFFEVLDLSLLGKARQKGILDVHVHDLRSYTTDGHRTVDDTPYGGGAGMVMRPEPWGRALDDIVNQCQGADSTIVFPTPSGERFSQPMAHVFKVREHLIFGCGRYEGIDERVFEYARKLAPVSLVSLGDYVLNGGEVAAIAMIEAIGRLIPGVVGNPQSLVSESHEEHLLEYPLYTKPALWRELEVPEILLSGHHQGVYQWRRERQHEKTARLRPDMLEKFREQESF